MADTIKVDYEVLNSIKEKYSAAEALVDEIIFDVDIIGRKLDSHYEGLASSIYPDCLERYIQQLEMLKAAFQTNREYIDYSGDKFQEADTLKQE